MPDDIDIPIHLRQFTLNDVPVDISMFCMGAALLDEELLRVGDLKVGEEIRFASGRERDYVLRRTK